MNHTPKQGADAELPPLPEAWQEFPQAAEGSRKHFAEDQMRDYGLACIAIGRGAAVRDYAHLKDAALAASVTAQQAPAPITPASDDAATIEQHRANFEDWYLSHVDGAVLGSVDCVKRWGTWLAGSSGCYKARSDWKVAPMPWNAPITPASDLTKFLDAADKAGVTALPKLAEVCTAPATPAVSGEAAMLAPILWGMCEGGGAEKGTDIYAENYQADDGDVYVRRAGELIVEQAAEIAELLRYIDMLAEKIATNAPAQASTNATRNAALEEAAMICDDLCGEIDVRNVDEVKLAANSLAWAIRRQQSTAPAAPDTKGGQQ